MGKPGGQADGHVSDVDQTTSSSLANSKVTAVQQALLLLLLLMMMMIKEPRCFIIRTMQSRPSFTAQQPT